MPRGIYDRTKTKEQREADKTKPGKKVTKAGAPKRKYTRKSASVVTEAVKSVAKTAGPDIGFFLMGEVRSNLTTLMQVAVTFGDLPSVKSEIEAHVAILGQLREKQITVSEDDSEESTDDSDEEDEIPGPENGTTIPARQASVPLPPPMPVTPALPTH